MGSELYKKEGYEKEMKKKLQKEYDADYKIYQAKRDAYNPTGKKKKKKHDPNAPKQPPNIFQRFNPYLMKEKGMKNDFKKFGELYKKEGYEKEMKKKLQKEYDADFKIYQAKRDAYNATGKKKRKKRVIDPNAPKQP